MGIFDAASRLFEEAKKKVTSFVQPLVKKFQAPPQVSRPFTPQQTQRIQQNIGSRPVFTQPKPAPFTPAHTYTAPTSVQTRPISLNAPARLTAPTISKSGGSGLAGAAQRFIQPVQQTFQAGLSRIDQLISNLRKPIEPLGTPLIEPTKRIVKGFFGEAGQAKPGTLEAFGEAIAYSPPGALALTTLKTPKVISKLPKTIQPLIQKAGSLFTKAVPKITPKVPVKTTTGVFTPKVTEKAPQLFKGAKELQPLAEEARKIPDIKIDEFVEPIEKLIKSRGLNRVSPENVSREGKLAWIGFAKSPMSMARKLKIDERTLTSSEREIMSKAMEGDYDLFARSILRPKLSQIPTQATGGVKPTLFGKAPTTVEVKPSTQELVDYEKQVLSEIQAEVKATQKADPNQQLITKMRNFLRFAGENKSKDTGLLFREHIPRSVFGQSSDELAASLGRSENELMAQLTEGISVGGGIKGIKPISIPRLSKKSQDMFAKLDPETYDVIRDVLGRVKVVSAQPSPQTLTKVAKREAQAVEQTAKAEFNEWKTNLFKQEARTTREAVESIVNEIDRQTVSPLSKNIDELHDIGNISKGFRDVFRNFQHVFGKKFEDAKRLILDPFDQAKGFFVKELNQLEEQLGKNVVSKGIKKGSRESELTQLYGEGQISLAELQAKAPQKWQDIIEADRWFRQTYDTLLNEVNAVRVRIYPNDPTKIIPRRQDYYRHFREMAEGIEGLRNIFDTPANIESHLSGISAFTKPKSKFLSFAQKRLGIKTDVDAVGGFIDYARAAAYAKHIDPHIGRFRALRQELATQTELGTPQAGKLNNFIEYLDDFANDLAGKTNPIDRVVQKFIPGGRQVFRAISWSNSRVKANVMLGNISSSLAQIFNVPQGMANVGNPKYWIKGVGDSLASMFVKNKPMEQSTFIAERYNRAFEKFNTGILKQPKRFGIWMITSLDEVGTKYIWNMHYQKAIAEGIANPIKYADDFTRQMVAGRGIGEVPLVQKAKLSQMVIPFQIEVGNLWWVMKDMVDEKAFGKLATLFVLNHIFNKAAEQVRGSGVTFDPIQAMFDSLETFEEEEDKGVGALRAGGRMAGEVLSNIPFGQTAAQFYPEYGVKIPGTEETLTRKEFFGREDPTRFGGGPLFAKGLTDPLFKLLPPFGGAQAKRTIEGTGAVGRGYSETRTGRVRFPIEQTPRNIAQGALFGQYAIPEGQKYFKEDRRPLGEIQSESFKLGTPEERKTYYQGILEEREVSREKAKQKETDIERIMPIYEEAQSLKEAGRLDEAKALVKSLSDEDYKIYKSIKESEQTKVGNILEKQMYSTVKEIQELVEQGREAEAKQIVKDMTDAEYKAYKAAKKALTPPKKQTLVPRDNVISQAGQLFGKVNPFNPPAAMAAETPRSTLFTPNRRIVTSSLNKLNVPQQYIEIIEQAASRYGVPPEILAAIAKHESAGTFDPNINEYSDGLGRGMFQIDLGQHPEITEEQAKDPIFSANFAAKLLADNYKQFGNWGDAIKAYNAGWDFNSYRPGYNGQPIYLLANQYLNNIRSLLLGGII